MYFDLLAMILSSISVPINIGGKTAANLGSHRPLAAPIALRVSGTVFLVYLLRHTCIYVVLIY